MLHGINPFGDMDASKVQQEEEKYEAEIAQKKKSLKKECENEAHRDDDHDEGEECATKKNHEELNLVGCDYPEFEKKMIERYGEKQFKDGYLLVKANKDQMYADGGEEKVKELLRKLEFKSEAELEDFLNNATTYVIISTMK